MNYSKQSTDYFTHTRTGYKQRGALVITVSPRTTSVRSTHIISNHSNDEKPLLDNMGSSQEPLLDEIQWRSPQIAQSMTGIQTNTGREHHVGKPPLILADYTFPVLPYFSYSPFFDKTSNNAIITTQAMFNQNLYYLIQTREAFEGRLKTMQGLEYMVSHDPSDNGRLVENTGVWVIRKQIRRKRPTGNDELTPISSYFVVGENIYMAPSVGNVLGSRLVCRWEYCCLIQ